MAEYYRSICELTFKYRDSKEVSIRKAVIALIPSMATYDSDDFEAHYLHRSMAYLLQALNRPADRDICESTVSARGSVLISTQHMWRWVIWPYILDPK